MLKEIHFPEVQEFKVSVNYVDKETVFPDSAIGQHYHDECEIFVHLGGDVSFIVEDRLYPIGYGDVVITRPGEYHHCIYHSKTMHRHFCILFSGKVNEELFGVFYNRSKGCDNLYSFSREITEQLISICHALAAEIQSPLQSYRLFLELIELISRSETAPYKESSEQSPLSLVLRLMHESYADHTTIGELAAKAHVSLSTIERLFADCFGTTPSEYLKNVRLTQAARLLSQGHSVSIAAEKCGFSDVSAMIAQFKRRYGVTPLVYKKEILRSEDSGF